MKNLFVEVCKDHSRKDMTPLDHTIITKDVVLQMVKALGTNPGMEEIADRLIERVMGEYREFKTAYITESN